MKKLRSIMVFLLFAAITYVCNASWSINSEIAAKITFNKTQTAPVAYIIGKPNQYTSIEKALDVAQSGDIVTVYPGKKENYCDKPNEKDDQGNITKKWNNEVIPDKVTYNIKRNCEIKQGVTLLLPTDQKSLDMVKDDSSINSYLDNMRNDDRSRGSASSYGQYATNNKNKYERTKINIDDGITLTNNGNLIISGYLSGGSNSGGLVGQTSHTYSSINLGQNAKIIQDNPNANLYCYGTINEIKADNNSEVILKKGTTNVPFVCCDYRGFSSTFAMTAGAMTKEHCSPFNRFILPNITTTLKSYYDSDIDSIINIYMKYSNPSIDKDIIKTVPVIGKDAANVIQLNNQNAYVKYKYNPSTTVAKVDFYGGLNLNNINISINEGISIDMSTKDAFLPISYQYDISLNTLDGQNEAIFDTTKQRIKLLTGSKMKLNKGALLKESDLQVYTSFRDGKTYNGYSSEYGVGGTYPLKKGAILSIDGGKIEGSSLAGTVYGDMSNINVGTTKLTTKEPWNLKSNDNGVNPPWVISDYLEINEELQVLPMLFIDKPKIYAGTNIFTNYHQFVPRYNILLSNSTVKSVDTYQKVFTLDNKNVTYQLDFVSNVYRAYKYNLYYEREEVIPYNDNNSMITVVNSCVDISNNRNGVNEFVAHKLDIVSRTKLLNEKLPLYVGRYVAFRSIIENAQLVYTKFVDWSVEDTSIATIDNNGILKGLSVGTTRVVCKIDDVIEYFDIEVLEGGEGVGDYSHVTINDSKGNNTDKICPPNENSTIKGDTFKDGTGRVLNINGRYKDNENIHFNVTFDNPEYLYAYIEWTFHASGVNRQYVFDNTQTIELIYDSESIDVHFVGGTGTSDDTLYADCRIMNLDGELKTYTFGMVHDNNVSCVAEGSLITMADGSLKKIEDVNINDKVLAYNHLTGKLEETSILAIGSHKGIANNKIELLFDDDSILNIVYSHDLFDYTLKKYVSINNSNYRDYIGHEFIKFDGNNFITKKLIDANLISGEFKYYSIETYKDLNCLVENTLSTTTMNGFNNVFTYQDNLIIDKEEMEKDIKQYGLLEYTEVKDFMNETLYEGFNVKYAKIAIVKGQMDESMLNNYVNMYIYYINSGELTLNDSLLK